MAQDWENVDGVNGLDRYWAAQRAIQAIQGARALDADPTNRHALLNRNIAENPGIDRRRGNFEYRVVIRGTGAGNEFESVIVIRSFDKMSGQEILDRAFQSAARNENWYNSRGERGDYKRRIEALGPTPTFDGWIMSASRHA